MVYVLYKIKYWEFSHTKDTLLWIFFTAFWLSFQTIDNRYQDKYLTTLLKSTFEVTLIVEFLVNTYTFSVITEIILIIILSFVNLMITYIKSTTNVYDNDLLYKLLNIINVFIGLIIGIFTLKKLWINSTDVLNTDTLKTFFLPIVFTIIYLPFFYFLLIQVLYEELFVLTKLNKKTSKKIIVYFKIKAFMSCKFDRNKILSLKNEKKHLIINMSTEDDIVAIFSS